MREYDIFLDHLVKRCKDFNIAREVADKWHHIHLHNGTRFHHAIDFLKFISASVNQINRDSKPPVS